MCPEFQRFEREFQNDLKIFEILDNPKSNMKRAKHGLMVKAYRRPTIKAKEEGNQNYQILEELRPPYVLEITMDYLASLLDNPQKIPQDKIYDFLFDRTRQIRQDFTMQGFYFLLFIIYCLLFEFLIVLLFYFNLILFHYFLLFIIYYFLLFYFIFYFYFLLFFIIFYFLFLLFIYYFLFLFIIYLFVRLS